MTQRGIENLRHEYKKMKFSLFVVLAVITNRRLES